MKCKDVHIHLKPDAKPYATHVPISVPIHWRDEVKADLDRDAKNGVIDEVPVGEPLVLRYLKQHIYATFHHFS